MLLKVFWTTTTFLVAIGITCAALSLIACSRINEALGLQDDNEMEEVLEIIIESKTGINIDLTPYSPERNATYRILV